MNSAVPFRVMQVDDLDAVTQIESTIYSHPWTRGNFSDSLKSRHEAWVLTEKEVIIGYALMMMVLDEAHLLNIALAKAYQKQGLGRLILNFMIDRARHLNALNMFLEVRVSNKAALSLYDSVGFVEMSIRKGYYPARKGREDAALMGLVI
ncbi:MAG: ribosomal protein S18-alanine N-acetyltransferase [Methylophilaceae bacterium]|nr:ribosomal protein S18-alanine N-acetyltransferase [Methylophilaceae bacterium]MDG2293865.1 ribosomal protein S18-alanine N-acetyltransferase [Methylophilaceae bacterium]